MKSQDTLSIRIARVEQTFARLLMRMRVSKSLNLIMLIYFITCASIFLDVPILRQVFGFLYLSFIPGYLFLRILKLDKVDALETVVFSAGLSISLLMFLGLLVNGISPALNLSQPLSTVPLMLVMSGLTLILFLLSDKRKEEENKPLSTAPKKVTTVLKVAAVCVLPGLSVVGAWYHNTSFIVLMIVGVAFLWAVSIVSDRLVEARIFPFVISLVSIALLFHTALVSGHLMGADIFQEFFVFRQTEIKGYWQSPGIVLGGSIIENLNSLLSVTILPTVYTTILGLDGEVFFKLFYPFVFSLLPQVLYKIYEQQIGQKNALLSTFFFISIPIAFYGLEPLSLARQITGQLFFALSILLMVENRIDIRKRRALLVIFAAALVVSHYSVAYIFLFFIIFVFLFQVTISTVFRRIRFLSDRKFKSKILSLGIVLSLMAITFLWYLYVSNSPFNQLLDSGHRIASYFSEDFSSPAARGFTGQLSSLSPTATTTLIGMIHKVLIYIEQGFIGVGVLVIIARPKRSMLSTELQLVAIAGMSILLLCLVVPNLSYTLNLTRFYAIVLPFLSSSFVIGGTFLIDFLREVVFARVMKLRNIPGRNLGLCVVTCVLIAAFLFESGFINHITNGYPSSFPLDLDRKDKSTDLSIRVTTHSEYFLDQEVLGAGWLSQEANSTSQVYADYYSRMTILRAYALLTSERTSPITNETRLKPRTYTYMSYMNVKVGVVLERPRDFVYFNTSQILPILENYNLVYSNGGSDVYYSP